MTSLKNLFIRWGGPRRHIQANLRDKTEQSILERLPGDLSQLDPEALDRMISLGLFPMEEGWIAGGYLAKLAVKRMRSEADGQAGQGPPVGSEQSSPVTCNMAQELKAVDPALPAEALLHIRTSLVRRGQLD